MMEGRKMRKTWLSFFILAFSVSAAWAQGSWRPLETVDQARQRHSAERYEIYKERGYQAPLGGYPERLGDPAPLGTESPGFTTPGRGSSPLSNTWQPRRPGLGSLDED